LTHAAADVPHVSGGGASGALRGGAGDGLALHRAVLKGEEEEETESGKKCQHSRWPLRVTEVMLVIANSSNQVFLRRRRTLKVQWFHLLS